MKLNPHVGELVDPHDSKSCAFGRVGSSPTMRTIYIKMAKKTKKIKFTVLTKEQVEADRSKAWKYLA